MEENNQLNILVYCHPRIITYKRLSNNDIEIENHWWSGIIKQIIIEQNLINKNIVIDTVDIKEGGTYHENGFSKKFINRFKNYYDLIFVPDCSGDFYYSQFNIDEIDDELNDYTKKIKYIINQIDNYNDNENYNYIKSLDELERILGIYKKKISDLIVWKIRVENTNYIQSTYKLLLNITNMLKTSGSMYVSKINESITNYIMNQNDGFDKSKFLSTEYSNLNIIKFKKKQIKIMNTTEHYFNYIKNGFKTIEVRLNKEPFNSYRIGDYIKLYNTEDYEHIIVEITNLVKYNSFRELLDSEKIYEIFPETDDKDIALDICRHLYLESENEESKHGVIAIHINYIN